MLSARQHLHPASTSGRVKGTILLLLLYAILYVHNNNKTLKLYEFIYFGHLGAIEEAVTTTLYYIINMQICVFVSAEWWLYLQVVTGHQEYASFDALPPGLCPCWIICGGVLPQVEGWGQRFGETDRGAYAVTLPLCAVGGRRALNPHIVVHLMG